MFKKLDEVISRNGEMANYIEDSDTYNSTLLKRLSDPTLVRENYEVNRLVYRPDLIAKEFYGDSIYSGFIIFQCKSLENLYRGNIIQLIPKDIFLSIINSI